MIAHVNTPIFDAINHPVLFELDYGQLLREQAEFEKQKATDAIPRTVAHYVSPATSEVAFSKQSVAEHMKSFGMDVIPILGDELAAMEGCDEKLGLILEHVSEINSGRFDELIENIESCLHQLGWNYDSWVCETVKDGESVSVQ